MTENPKNFSAPTITCPGCNQRIALLHATPFYIADALDTHSNSCPAGHCHLPRRALPPARVRGLPPSLRLPRSDGGLLLPPRH